MDGYILYVSSKCSNYGVRKKKFKRGRIHKQKNKLKINTKNQQVNEDEEETHINFKEKQQFVASENHKKYIILLIERE